MNYKINKISIIVFLFTILTVQSKPATYKYKYSQNNKRFGDVKPTVMYYEDSEFLTSSTNYKPNDKDVGFPEFNEIKEHAIINDHYQDSPIYYIKLPPAPYNFIPGYGYISQTPLNILPFPLAPLTIPPGPINPSIYQLKRPAYVSTPLGSEILNVPVEFVANGRPNNIYQLHNDGLMNILKSRLPPNRYIPSRYLNHPDSTLKHYRHPSLLFNGKPEKISIHNASPTSEYDYY